MRGRFLLNQHYAHHFVLKEPCIRKEDSGTSYQWQVVRAKVIENDIHRCLFLMSRDIVQCAHGVRGGITVIGISRALERI